MKRFYRRASFYFLLGLSVGLAISWTSFIQAIMQAFIELLREPYGLGVIFVIFMALINIMSIIATIRSVSGFFRQIIKETETTRKQDIQECVKLALSQLGYNTELRNGDTERGD